MKKQLERLMFVGIGGLIAIISFSIGNTEKDTANAQDQTPIVDTIRCRKLEVLDKDGKTVASLDALELEIEKIMGNSPGGTLRLFNGDGKQGVILDSEGMLGLSSKDGEGSVLLSSGSGLFLMNKNLKGGVTLKVHEDGGILRLYNKAGKEIGYFGVSKQGGGLLTTSDKNGFETGSVP